MPFSYGNWMAQSVVFCLGTVQVVERGMFGNGGTFSVKTLSYNLLERVVEVPYSQIDLWT